MEHPQIESQEVLGIDKNGYYIRKNDVVLLGLGYAENRAYIFLDEKTIKDIKPKPCPIKYKGNEVNLFIDLEQANPMYSGNFFKDFYDSMA